MKHISEIYNSPEYREAYATIQAGSYMLKDIIKRIDRKHISDTAYIQHAKLVLTDIMEAKKVLGRDTTQETQLLKEIKQLEK